MELRALRYFLASFEEGSVSSAARKCNVAQPSVSQAVQKLEVELQTKLFTRSVQGLSPTPAGIALAGRARAILAEVAEIKAGAGKGKTPQAIVRLFIHPTIAMRKIVPILQKLGAGGKIDLRLTMEQSEADLAIVPGEGHGREQPLWSERYDLLVAAADPLATRENIQLVDLVGIRLIARCACERPQMLPTDIVKPNIVAQVHDEESVIALVSAGIGASIVPGYDLNIPAVVARQVQGFAVERRIVATGQQAVVNSLLEALQ